MKHLSPWGRGIFILKSKGCGGNFTEDFCLYEPRNIQLLNEIFDMIPKKRDPGAVAGAGTGDFFLTQGLQTLLESQLLHLLFFLLRDGTHLKKSYLKTSKAPERHKLAIFFLVVTQYCGFRASYKTLDFFKDAILGFFHLELPV